MKKLIIFIMICALTVSLCACGVRTTTYSDGQKKKLNDQFTVVKIVSTIDDTCCYLYDNETKIVYLYTTGFYRATMCLYYIMVNNKPEIAVYGVNWNG